jgi:DNA-binding response OmpR family regulator
MSETQPVILAIDDTPEILMSLFSILMDSYDVRTAKTATAAFSVLHAEHVALILLDIEMPRMSGFEFLEYLHHQSDYANIPVIFITSNSEQDTVIHAMEMGAKGYIVKPFTRDKVLEKIAKVLEENKPL